MNLGLWSARARVRRKRYFLSTTTINGDVLDYLADGLDPPQGLPHLAPSNHHHPHRVDTRERAAVSAAEGHMAARLRIHGRVQGVWFRGWTVDRAQALGLSGWVRNRRDGTVEALVSGPSDAVEQMIAACHGGPPTARVDLVEHGPAAGLSASGFTQKPTV